MVPRYMYVGIPTYVDTKISSSSRNITLKCRDVYLGVGLLESLHVHDVPGRSAGTRIIFSHLSLVCFLAGNLLLVPTFRPPCAAQSTDCPWSLLSLWPALLF